MKNILAIDTASAYLSLALKVGDKIYKHISKVDSKQSEYIIPEIIQLISAAGITVSEVDHIAYNQGPGSFTGLRIGLSVALGISFGINALLIPIPAFAMYALQAYDLSGCERILVGLDARLNQLYFAGIDVSTLEYFIPPQLINPGDIYAVDAEAFIGSGFTMYRDLLPKIFNDMEIIDANYPDATYLLKLATYGKFQPVTAADADLLYLRNKVALNLDEQKHKTSNFS